MKTLNLGAGKKLLPGAVNVDVMPYPGIDEVVDLSVFPWPWADESFDRIMASHVMEHFPDQKQFIEECLRVLKRGGHLRIVAPHASCITSVGCLGHYRTYSYNTFHDYLSKPFYMFKTARFKTYGQALRWWYEEPDAEENLPKWMMPFIRLADCVINAVIWISPRLFENVFCSFIQVREVIWIGEKL